MGNPYLCDDAVGVRLARHLRDRLGPLPGLTAIPECPVGGLDLVDVIAGFDRVIVVDSIKTGAAPPGSFYHFTAARHLPFGAGKPVW